MPKLNKKTSPADAQATIQTPNPQVPTGPQAPFSPIRKIEIHLPPNVKQQRLDAIRKHRAFRNDPTNEIPTLAPRSLLQNFEKLASDVKAFKDSLIMDEDKTPTKQRYT